MTADAIILRLCAGALAWAESSRRLMGAVSLLVPPVMGFSTRGARAVIGGGNTAVEEALYLANICEKVTLCIVVTRCWPSRSCRTDCSGMRKLSCSGI